MLVGVAFLPLIPALWNIGILHHKKAKLRKHMTGMHQGGRPGGPLPPQILADQKAPPGSGGAPHYYLPPRIFDPCCIPATYLFRKSSGRGQIVYGFHFHRLCDKYK